MLFHSNANEDLDCRNQYAIGIIQAIPRMPLILANVILFKKKSNSIPVNCVATIHTSMTKSFAN
jgi:hypothetical protein